MDKKQKIINLIILTLLAVTCILKLPILTIALTFVYVIVEHQMFGTELQSLGFKFKQTGQDMKDNWYFILIALVMGALSVLVARWILPDYNPQSVEGADTALNFGQGMVLLMQLLIVTYFEELTFRTVLQGGIGRILENPILALFMTSVLFTIAHISVGEPMFMAIDLSFLFLGSVIYGIIYVKTENLFTCWVAHFVANVASMVVLLLI